MRTLVKTLAAAGLLSALTFGIGNASGALRNARSYVAGRYELELDGTNSGWVYDVAGGSAVAEVVEVRTAATQLTKKQLGAVKYEDIALHVGTGMSKSFYQWIADTMGRKYPRKNGAIIAMDYNQKEMVRTTFSNALLSEVEFPALDAASKDAAKLAVTFTPESTRAVGPSAATSGKAVANHEQAATSKKWSPANFRLKIDGLDSASKSVSKVDPVKIKMKTVEHAVGQMRDYQVEPSTIEYSNLVVTVPESQADAFFKWHEDFVIKGASGDDKEKSATLEYLSANLQNVYFTLSFKHLGIFKIEPEKNESGSENIRKVRVYMYFEDAALTVGKDVSL